MRPLMRALRQLLERGETGLPRTGRDIGDPDNALSGVDVGFLDAPMSRQGETVRGALRDSTLSRAFQPPSDSNGTWGAWRLLDHAIANEPTWMGLGPHRFRTYQGRGRRDQHGYDNVRRIGSHRSLSEAEQALLRRLDPTLGQLLLENPRLLRELGARGVRAVRGMSRRDRAPTELELPKPDNAFPYFSAALAPSLAAALAAQSSQEDI